MFILSVFLSVCSRLVETDVAVLLEIVGSVSSIEATEPEVVRSPGRQSDVLEVAFVVMFCGSENQGTSSECIA